MKRLGIALLVCFVFIAACGPGQGKKQKEQGGSKSGEEISGSLRIDAGNVVYALARIWAVEFGKANPKVLTDVRKTDGSKALRNLRSGSTQAAIIERPLNKEEINAGLWAVPVAKDALLPIINFENQYIQNLVMSGLSKKQLCDIFTGKASTWAQLFNKISAYKLHAVVLQDSSGSAEIWAQFIGAGTSALKGENCNSDQGVVEAVLKAPSGIGFCSMIFLFNNRTGLIQKGLYIPPIDFNDNAQADDSELFYDKWLNLKQAINSGQYPSPPARELFLVLKEKPKDKMLKEFVNWVLTIGQNYTDQQGYIFIPKEKAAMLIKSME